MAGRNLIRVENLLPPDHLNDDATEHWDEVIAALSIDHELTKADRDILAIYCDYYARWRKARCNIESAGLLIQIKGESNPRPNPYIAIADQCAREMRNLLSELGMTPASRRRLRALRDKEISRDDIASIRIEIPPNGAPRK